jgi:FPC/CPF motif-containing protein YcgG
LPITDHQAVGKQIRNPLRGDKKASQYSAYHGPRDGGLQRLLPPHTEAEGPIIWVHDMLRSTVLNQQYPCIGARSAFNRDHYRIGFYPSAATEPASLGLAHDLYEFTQEYSDQSVPFYSFIAVFDGPVASTEVEFERLLWEQLQALHNIDARYSSWDSFVTRDPDHPQFCFSFGGKGYFVVGLHAAASRLARRFAWPAMVFNAHEMFDRVRDDGKFPKLQSTIRNRDQRLQGFINPVVKDFGTESEARQYSGRNVENDWRCPFRPRDAGQS